MIKVLIILVMDFILSEFYFDYVFCAEATRLTVLYTKSSTPRVGSIPFYRLNIPLLSELRNTNLFYFALFFLNEPSFFLNTFVE